MTSAWENFLMSNIVERSNGLKLEKILCHNEDFDKRLALHNIIKKCENHS